MEETLKNSNFPLKLLKFGNNHQYKMYLNQRWKQIENYQRKSVQYQQLTSLILSEYLSDKCKNYNYPQLKKNKSNKDNLKNAECAHKQNLNQKSRPISNIFNFYEKNPGYPRNFKVGVSTKQGHFLKNNQDNIFIGNQLFILCDGYGKNGKQISIQIANFLYQSFQYVFTKKIASDSLKINQSIISNYIKQIFKEAEVHLNKSQISLKSSGTTSLVLQILDNFIICANCGNTQAILIKNGAIFSLTQQENIVSQREQLYKRIVNHENTKLHSPRSEIKSEKYTVSNLFNEFEGFGTTLNQIYQIKKKPFINFYQRCYQDQFIILGSNSLFRYIPKQIMMQICKKMLKKGKSTHQISMHLTNQAKFRWKTIQHEDISCILINLKLK